MLLSVVITSYNDQPIIEPYFEAIRSTLSRQETFNWEILYVDDGSSDGSLETLNRIAQEDSHVTVIELARNFGQQKAFLAGIKRARGDVIITLDGDFQYPPDCLMELARKTLGGYDIVSGVRVHRKDPLLTRTASVAGQIFIRKIFQVPVQDFGAIKAFSRFIVGQILRYESYCTNVYGLAYALTNRFIEIPVEHLPRPTGHSKWNLTKRLHVYFDLYLAYYPYESTRLLKFGFLTLLGFLALYLILYFSLSHDIFFHMLTAVLFLAMMGISMGLILGSLFFSFLLRIYRQLLWKGNCYVERRVIHLHPESRIDGMRR